MTVHRSGFVNIVGMPNVGKSTLMNRLVGERMAIITPKPQTTRHRLIGIVSADDYQIVFSDTPGFVEGAAYRMQKTMNAQVREAFEDADLVLFMTDVRESYPAGHPLFEQLRVLEVPVFLVLNKVDLVPPERVAELVAEWRSRFAFAEIIPIAAVHGTNTDFLFEKILTSLPEGPEYYPKDQLTDRPERFFVSEIVREKILEQYQQEIPYSCEVEVESFKEGETSAGEALVRIAATIYVNRKTQKSILIGKNGESIKRLGTAARQSVEAFLEKKVFLELYVKVREGWRDDEQTLRRFGYQS
jgi:GTP-binding protein Era